LTESIHNDILMIVILICCSLIAQLVEHSTVNRVVTGSSPVRGAIICWRDTQVAIRGPSAKGLDCESGAWVRIPLSPPYFSLANNI
jgi:hypothetical protein